MGNRQKQTKIISMLLAGVFLFTSLPSVSAASPEYADLYIKVHINTKDGRLYTFNPESPETDDAFTIGFTPIQAPDISNIDAFKKNRDFAQSLFLKIEGFPSIAQYTPTSQIQQSETALLVNGTGFKQNDPISNHQIFLLSPYDGFLHFKVKKNTTFSSPVKVSIVPPKNISQEFQIDPDTAHENHTIRRSKLPYGLWNQEDIGAPAGGIYEETIDFSSIFTQNPNVKTIIVDLIVMRHEGRLMPLIVPPSTNNTQSNWIPSELVTYVQQFAIRAHHALDWILKIDNWGVDHTAITKYYNKITSVVNGFLILIILVIALMWNFSIVIPRSRLRKVMMMYVIVSIVVNFSTPVIKLIIDGSNILQTSFMVTKDKQTGEFRKMEAKDFFDFGGLEYNNFLGYDLENGTETRPVRSLSVEGTLTNLNTQFNVTGNGRITIPNMNLGGGSLSIHESDSDGSSRSGTIEDPERTITGGTANLNITGNIAPQQTIDLGRNGLNIHIEYPINTRLEDRLFNSALLILSGIGYYLVGLVFLFRIVVLWFLIILSPLLVLLMIMPAMQQYFRYWAQVFVRWIAIGPLLAICIGATVFIWKEIGIPLTSLYSSHLTYLQSTNFAIASPGSISTGLNYTKPMMEYIVGLLMLYIPVLLAFWLTRKLPCCFSDSNKSIVTVRTKLQPSHLESPEPVPSPSPSPSKEPPVGDILTNIKLAPAGPVEPEDGMFLSPEEKEAKIRASSVSAIPITKEKEEAVSFEEQSTEEPKHVGTVNINTAQKDGIQIGLSRDQQQDAITKEQSEWGISQFVESSPSFTGLSTADLMEQYQNLEQQKQQEREEGNVIGIMSQQMALADEIKHRAQMGDQKAQQIAVELDLHPEKRERDNRLEADKQAYLHQKAESIEPDQLEKTSLSQKVSVISSPQEYGLPQEEIRGLTSGIQEDTQQEENDVEETIRPYRTTHKAQAEMLEMDMDREAMEHMSMLQQQENEYVPYTKLEKGQSGAEEKKDVRQEKSIDKTKPKGKKNNKKDDRNDSSDNDNGPTSMDQKEESPSKEADAEMKRIENEDDSDLFHDTGEESVLLPHEERKELRDGKKEDQQGPEDVLEKIKKDNQRGAARKRIGTE